MEERNVDSADEYDLAGMDPQQCNSPPGQAPDPPFGGILTADAADATLTAGSAAWSASPPSLATIALSPGTSGVVWGEVVEYDYDIPEVEATEVELEVGDAEDGDKGNDESGDVPTEENQEEVKRNVSKWWTYVSVASTFIGMSAASQLMNPDVIDEDDVVGIAAIVNSGAAAAHAAATASVQASGTTATAAAGAGGVSASHTFASAAGIGSTSTK
jgi:hypothetical protein